MSEKSRYFKELTPSSQTYELNGQGKKKSSTQNQDKQTPHTVLQKLSPKLTPSPLTHFAHPDQSVTQISIGFQWETINENPFVSGLTNWCSIPLSEKSNWKPTGQIWKKIQEQCSVDNNKGIKLGFSLLPLWIMDESSGMSLLIYIFFWNTNTSRSWGIHRFLRFCWNPEFVTSYIWVTLQSCLSHDYHQHQMCRYFH